MYYCTQGILGGGGDVLVHTGYIGGGEVVMY